MKRKPKPENTKGRKTKLTKEVLTTVVDVLRGGATYEAAARAAGIHPDTLDEWRRRGEGRDPRPAHAVYVRFATEVHAAVAEAERRWVQRIDAASALDWRAGAFLLERRHPDRYGKADRTKIEHSGSIAQPVAVKDLDGYTMEELAELDRIEDARAERQAAARKATT